MKISDIMNPDNNSREMGRHNPKGEGKGSFGQKTSISEKEKEKPQKEQKKEIAGIEETKV